MANPSGKVFSKIASVISTPWRSTIGASERRESSSCCSPVSSLGEKRLQPLAFVSPEPLGKDPPRSRLWLRLLPSRSSTVFLI